MLKRKTGLALPNPLPTKPIVQAWALRLVTRVMPVADWFNGRGFVSDRLAASLGLDLSDLEAASPQTQQKLRKLLTHQLETLDAQLAIAPPQEQSCCEGLQPLVQALGLNATEAAVLDLACAMTTEVTLRDVLSRINDLDRQSAYQLVARTLDCPVPEVKQALGKQGVLARSGVLVLRSRDNLRGDRVFEMLNSDLPQVLYEPDTELDDVLRSVVHETTPGSLTLADFAHLQGPLQHLVHYLRAAARSSQKGVNVLLYGPPGTGKTELAKVLANEMGLGLYEVASMDVDGDPTTGADRMKSLMLAQVCLSKGANLLLFDEVEDVLQPPTSFFDNERKTKHKAWMNRQLETNAVPTVWVTNSVSRMDPAMARRFDVVLEVPVPPRAQREKIVGANTGTALDSAWVAALADHETLSPAIVARAARVAGAEHGPDTLLQLVNQTLKVQGLSPVAKPTALSMRDSYSLHHLNPDVPLQPLVDALLQQPVGRMCLYGPPGTGKSAFVHWVAQQLGKPLVVRRASDLLSKWVGENEKNIASAFAQAERDGAVLLFDEVDTFLQPREHASHGWEASLVNEMLTQLEAYPGLVFATTNLFKGMDAAAMRRFDLKVQFKPPTAQQLEVLLHKVGTQLKTTGPNAAQCARLAQLGITPGDVAAVVRRCRFAPVGSADALFQVLEAEGLCKPGAVAGPMGFV